MKIYLFLIIILFFGCVDRQEHHELLSSKYPNSDIISVPEQKYSYIVREEDGKIRSIKFASNNRFSYDIIVFDNK